MPAEHYILGVYWGPREEAATGCAERASKFLSGIRSIDPIFGKWYQTDPSLEQSAKLKVEISPSNLSLLLEKGVHRSDIDKSIIRDLGFSLHMWNLGHGGGWVNLSLQTGGYSPWNTNACVIDLPHGGETADRVVQFGLAKHLMQQAVDCWQPDQGIVTSHEFRDAIDSDGTERFVGWLTFVSLKFGEFPEVPAPASVDKLAEKGHLIVLSHGVWSASDRNSVELARRVADICGFARRGIT